MSWLVIGDGGEGSIAGVHCIYAVMVNDDYGYQEHPCNESVRVRLGEPLKNLYCDADLRIPAPDDDLAKCPDRHGQ